MNKDPDFLPLDEGTFPAAKPSPGIYTSILLLVISFVFAIFFIRADVVVTVPGVARPLHERSEIKATATGKLKTVLCKEGERVTKNSLIAEITNEELKIRDKFLDQEITGNQKKVHDLRLLTRSSNTFSTIRLEQIITAPIRQQVLLLRNRLEELAGPIAVLEQELATNNLLLAGKIIAPRDAFIKTKELERQLALRKTLPSEQLLNWEIELETAIRNNRDHKNTKAQLSAEADRYRIKAPVNGFIQYISDKYPGVTIREGEPLCSISPDTTLIAECFVPTHQAGTLAPDQRVRFQIGAFDYNYFGTLTGKVLTIDEDYSLQENKGIYKVKCRFDQTTLSLKNGFKGHLKKGMSFQCSFIIGRRSIFQLLYDQLYNWFNPAAPSIKLQSP